MSSWSGRGKILLLAAVTLALALPAPHHAHPLGTAAPAVQADWPMLSNNSQRTGFNPDETVLDPSNVGSLAVAWKGPTGGKVNSSTAVVNDVVYAGSLDGKLYAFPTSCSDPCSPLWKGSTGGPIFSSPTVTGGVVYVGSDDGNLYAFPASCTDPCSPLWKGPTGGPVASSAVVHNGTVFAGSDDGNLYAFPESCSDPCSPLWKGPARGRSSPSVDNGVVYVGTLDHTLNAFDADGCGGATCQPLWEGATGDSIQSTPAVAGGVVFVGSTDNKVYAFPASCSDPCAPLWTGNTGGAVRSSAAVANGVMYIGSGDGKLYAFDAGGCGNPSCSPLWTGNAGTHSIKSSPAVANGVVYVGSGAGKLFAFPASCSDPCSALWEYDAGGLNAFRTSPAVVNGMVFAGSEDFNVYAFALPQGGGPKPNVVLILTDDQRWDTLWAMPNVRKRLGNSGVQFSNAFVANPVCCPSRASILTGQYSHSTGVYTNGGTNGGFNKFDDAVTVATAVHDGGYRTALIGKYLNGYTNEDAAYVAPGWDRWFVQTEGGAGGGYYGVTVSDNGTLKTFGNTVYSTDLYRGEALKFIRSTPSDKPFLLYFAPKAPHPPATPAVRHENEFSDLEDWRPPSYNEADVSDKPAYIRNLPPMSQQLQDAIDEFRINQYRTLLAVDEAVAAIVKALAQSGRLDNTLLIFASDNGTLWGEHRWQGKDVPYEEDIRIPLVVRYDPVISDPRLDPHLVRNIDLAPTIADVAGVNLPGVEGQSLVPLLASPGAPWPDDFLVEHAAQLPFCQVRNEGYTYVRHASQEEELYDLALDPYQLDNVVSDPDYADVLNALRNRTEELCVPLPPGFE